MAIRFTQRAQNTGPLRVSFTLPGSDSPIDTGAAFAWSNNAAQAGLRFVDLSIEHRSALKAWLTKHSPEVEAEDPPVACKLTDLSLGGCYLQIVPPFPVGTRVTIGMRAGEVRAEVEGTVRVAHQETGMGVQFARTTAQQVQLVEKFVQTLVSRKDIVPELDVAPEGMEEVATTPAVPLPKTIEDPMLDLFLSRNHLPVDAFLGELRRQRNPRAAAAQAAG